MGNRGETDRQRGIGHTVALWWGQVTSKENGGGGKMEDFDALEVEEEMVQKSMLHGMESCRDAKENEDGRVANMST